jgi:uncharacterized membrane protein
VKQGGYGEAMSVPMADAPEAGAQVFLDAVLHPHRSLPPKGFAAVMAVLGGVSLATGIGFVLHGAWPVCGFFGLDVLLVYVAFRASYRSARQHEWVRLTERDLTIERVSVRGERRRWRFEPVWLRVTFEERDEYTNRLVLASHGRSLVVGSFLAPEERRRFAGSLQGALARWRAFIRAA